MTNFTPWWSSPNHRPTFAKPPTPPLKNLVKSTFFGPKIQLSLHLPIAPKSHSPHSPHTKYFPYNPTYYQRTTTHTTRFTRTTISLCKTPLHHQSPNPLTSSTRLFTFHYSQTNNSIFHHPTSEPKSHFSCKKSLYSTPRKIHPKPLPKIAKIGNLPK